MKIHPYTAYATVNNINVLVLGTDLNATAKQLGGLKKTILSAILLPPDRERGFRDKVIQAFKCGDFNPKDFSESLLWYDLSGVCTAMSYGLRNAFNYPDPLYHEDGWTIKSETVTYEKVTEELDKWVG